MTRASRGQQTVGLRRDSAPANRARWTFCRPRDDKAESVNVLTDDLTTDVVAELLQADFIAVDTETSGLSWQNDRLLLCQLFTPATGAILLRNVKRRPPQLARVLRSPRNIKVFHFAPFDLRFLSSQWGIMPANVACTKAASKILDPHLPASAHSLSQLTARYLGVILDKGAVRTSDWGVPTLSAEQVTYAASDVAHLPDLLTALTARLRATGQFQTWRRVCRYMAVDARLEIDGVPNPLIY